MAQRTGRAYQAAETIVVSVLLAMVPSADPVQAETAQTIPQEVHEYLEYFIGTWESTTTILNSDGTVRLESEAGFGEAELIPNHLNLHTSHNPDGTENKAFRFYAPEENKVYLIDVTSTGAWWVLSGVPGGSVMTSLPRTLPDGRTAVLRFTHSQIRDSSYEATMHVSLDGGTTWEKRSEQSYRRASRAAGSDETISGDAAAFEKMASYLTRGSGRWRAPNDAHDYANPSSPEALGLWFRRSAGGNLLELTVVGYFGEESRKGSQSYWFWDPDRKQTVYQEVSPNGAIRRGTAAFTDDETFITLTRAVSPTGETSENRGENVILSETAHRTTAFAKDATGAWVAQRSLTWELEPSNEPR